MTYREIKAPLKGGTIVIGKVGEKDAEKIAFDITGYTDYTVTVIHQRQTDTLPYAVSNTEIDGSTLYWIPNKSDTSIKGFGKLEIQFRSGDAVVKSITYETCVKGALGDAAEEPDPHEAWYDKMVAQAVTAATARDEAVQAKDDADTSASNASESAALAVASAEGAGESEVSAKSAAESAALSAEHAEQVAFKNGYFYFDIDSSGNLIETRTENVSEDIEFSLNDDGTMEVTFK